MNTQSLHLDAPGRQATEFGERLVNSMFTLSTLVGLSVAQLTQGTIVANLGFESVRFPHPMRHGDTMTRRQGCCSKRLSAAGRGRAIVEFEHTAREPARSGGGGRRPVDADACRPAGG